jgi:hypothetical protein
MSSEMLTELLIREELRRLHNQVRGLPGDSLRKGGHREIEFVH